MSTHELPIAVIGAGPVGLAAAANILVRGGTPVVFEAGEAVAASIREWGHVRMFSPWEFDIDAAARKLLEAADWSMPSLREHPTGAELVARYLEPLAALPAMRQALRLGHNVVGITRRGFDKVKTEGRADAPFVLRVIGPDGVESEHLARAVIDASGTWTRPNPMGAGGFAALGETAARDRIAYGIPDVLGSDRDAYAGQRTAVIGSGHSAINALVDLAALAEQVPGTRVVWVMRKPSPMEAFGGGEADQLPERGALGLRIKALVQAGKLDLATGFRVTRVGRDGGRVVLHGADGRSLPVDRAIVATGFRPDLAILRELRLDLDPALDCPVTLGPMIDPNLHSCGTVRPHGYQELAQPEPGFFIAGMKAYGRAPTFLLATGYEQVRSIVAHLMGDDVAARRVELRLPETGVCKAPAEVTVGAAACCGPAAGKREPAAAGAGCCGS